MKLLIVSAYFEEHRGGVERVAGHIARGLSASGIEVEWLACDASKPDMSDTSVTKIPVRAWNGIQEKVGVPSPLWGLKGIRAMNRAVARADAVMLQDTLYFGNILTFLAAKLRRKPVMIVQHVGAIRFSNRLLRAMMWTGDKLVGRPMLRTANAVVFISQAVKAEFNGIRFRRDPEIIFNGVDTQRFTPVRNAVSIAHDRRLLGLRAKSSVVLFSGRFVERKGLKIIRGLAESMPDVDFLLAGWGPIDPASWQLANVFTTVADTAAEMKSIYDLADLMILPSVGEGLPLVVQEALASGLRVICSAEIPAADEALRGHVDCARTDPDNLAETISDWRSAIGTALERVRGETDADRNSRATFAASRYGWPRGIARYLELLKEITGKPAP